MTSSNPLYELLPEVLRTRDAELGHPLRSLLNPLAQEYRRARADVDRLYDNWFVETCEPDVLPLLLELAGGFAAEWSSSPPRRAFVANSVRNGRLKGTAEGLRRMATEATGWPAHVVEYFELLCTTQQVNHVRAGNVRTPDLRDTDRLARLATAFDDIPRSPDIRDMADGVVRHNLGNVGVHLWRLNAYPFDGAHARAVDKAQGRWTFDPAGRDTPLFTADALPLTRLDLHRDLAADSPQSAPRLAIDGVPVSQRDLISAELSAWARPDGDRVALDPQLGRITVAPGRSPERIEVHYHAGFPADVGPHPHDRGLTLGAALGTETALHADWRVVVRQDGGGSAGSITEAVRRWNSLPRTASSRFGVIVVADSATYHEDLTAQARIVVPTGDQLLVVAAVVPDSAPDALVPLGVRPHIAGTVEVVTDGDRVPAPTELVLDGLSIEGDVHVLPGGLDALVVSSCSLRTLQAESNPRLACSLLRSLAQRVTVAGCPRAVLRDSILHAASPAVAVNAGGAEAEVSGCTVLGGTTAGVLAAADSILFGAVTVATPGSGYLRHSFAPADSQLPAAQHGVPGASPVFTSTDPAHPAFCQLAADCPAEITSGAQDSGELGAYHHTGHSPRIAGLARQLDRYLLPGLRAGTQFAT